MPHVGRGRQHQRTADAEVRKQQLAEIRIDLLIVFKDRQAHVPQTQALPENRGKIALFGGVKNARFKRQVIPGDVLELECTLTKRRGPVGIGACTATVNGETACTAELIFAIQ